jgi:RTX calcium-binding nonapeptide repeat (4 copies)
MPARRHRTHPTLVVVSALALLVVTSALASTIRGSARGEMLRGTIRADSIHGLGGNDRLYGLGGNDRLTGGAGADRFYCGAGRDTVLAEAGEWVASDCEIVKRQPKRKPATIQPGTYCGFTHQGPGLCLSTSDDLVAVAELKTSAQAGCTDGSRVTLTLSFSGERTPIQPDRSFTYRYSGPIASGSEALTNLQASYMISGRFALDGTASGTVAVTSFTFTEAGVDYMCSQTPVAWNAKRQ